jgi:hypothetical protein
LTNIFSEVSVFSTYVPAVAVLWRYKYLKQPYKLYGLFLVFTILTETVAYVLRKNGVSNLIIFHFYHLFNFSITTYFIINLKGFSKLQKQIAYAGVLLFAAGHVYYTFILDDFVNAADNIQLFLESLWLPFWSLLFMRMYLQADEVEFNSLPFLCVFAIMFYYMTNFFIFCSYEVIMVEKMLPFNPWVIQSIVNIITNGIYTYAFLCLAKTKSSY